MCTRLNVVGAFIFCMGPNAWMFFKNCRAIKKKTAISKLWGLKIPNERLLFLITPFPYSPPLPTFPKMRTLCPVTTLLLFLFALHFCLCIAVLFSLNTHFPANKKRLQARSVPPALSTLYRVHGQQLCRKDLISLTEVVDSLPRSTNEIWLIGCHLPTGQCS